jgi:hypothetical protein
VKDLLARLYLFRKCCIRKCCILSLLFSRPAKAGLCSKSQLPGTCPSARFARLRGRAGLFSSAPGGAESRRFQHSREGTHKFLCLSLVIPHPTRAGVSALSLTRFGMTRCIGTGKIKRLKEQRSRPFAFALRHRTQTEPWPARLRVASREGEGFACPIISFRKCCIRIGNAVLGNAVLGNAVLGNAVLGNAVLGNAVLGNAVSSVSCSCNQPDNRSKPPAPL